MNRKKIILILIGLFAVVCTCFIGVGWWAMESHGFNFAAYQQIQNGMTDTQAELLMGKPSLIEKLNDGESAWTYASRWKWCVGHVSFDRDNKVKDKDHDH